MKPVHQIATAVRGTIGTQVYQRVGKGRGNIATPGRHDLQLRRYVIPTDYKTEAQQRHRRRLAAATAAWQALTPDEWNTWNKKAQKMRRSGFNLFVQKFCRAHPISEF
ncbi:MAG: hypothetical protein RKO25_03850 [Candidatus Contendobacter sp.]|nr:hypothetical protein [Candidatus Contendobacter sp.]